MYTYNYLYIIINTMNVSKLKNTLYVKCTDVHMLLLTQYGV